MVEHRSLAVGPLARRWRDVEQLPPLALHRTREAHCSVVSAASGSILNVSLGGALGMMLHLTPSDVTYHTTEFDQASSQSAASAKLPLGRLLGAKVVSRGLLPGHNTLQTAIVLLFSNASADHPQPPTDADPHSAVSEKAPLVATSKSHDGAAPGEAVPSETAGAGRRNPTSSVDLPQRGGARQSGDHECLEVVIYSNTYPPSQLQDTGAGLQPPLLPAATMGAFCDSLPQAALYRLYRVACIPSLPLSVQEYIAAQINRFLERVRGEGSVQIENDLYVTLNGDPVAEGRASESLASAGSCMEGRHVQKSPKPLFSVEDGPPPVFVGTRPLCRPWASTPLQPLAGSKVTFKLDPGNHRQLDILWGDGAVWRSIYHMVFFYGSLLIYVLTAILPVAMLIAGCMGLHMPAGHAFAHSCLGEGAAETPSAPPAASSASSPAARLASASDAHSCDTATEASFLADPFYAVSFFCQAFLLQLCLAGNLPDGLCGLRIRLRAHAAGVRISDIDWPWPFCVGWRPVELLRALLLWSTGAAKDEDETEGLLGARVYTPRLPLGLYPQTWIELYTATRIHRLRLWGMRQHLAWRSRWQLCQDAEAIVAAINRTVLLRQAEATRPEDPGSEGISCAYAHARAFKASLQLQGSPSESRRPTLLGTELDTSERPHACVSVGGAAPAAGGATRGDDSAAAAEAVSHRQFAPTASVQARCAHAARSLTAGHTGKDLFPAVHQAKDLFPGSEVLPSVFTPLARVFPYTRQLMRRRQAAAPTGAADPPAPNRPAHIHDTHALRSVALGDLATAALLAAALESAPLNQSQLEVLALGRPMHELMVTQTSAIRAQNFQLEDGMWSSTQPPPRASAHVALLSRSPGELRMRLPWPTSPCTAAVLRVLGAALWAAAARLVLVLLALFNVVGSLPVAVQTGIYWECSFVFAVLAGRALLTPRSVVVDMRVSRGGYVVARVPAWLPVAWVGSVARWVPWMRLARGVTDDLAGAEVRVTEGEHGGQATSVVLHLKAARMHTRTRGESAAQEPLLPGAGGADPPEATTVVLAPEALSGPLSTMFGHGPTLQSFSITDYLFVAAHINACIAEATAAAAPAWADPAVATRV